MSGVNYSRMVGDLVRAVASPNLKVQSSSVPQINALVMRILKNLSQLLNQTRDGGATTRRRSRWPSEERRYLSLISDINLLGTDTTLPSRIGERDFFKVSDGIAAPPSLPTRFPWTLWSLTKFGF